MNRGNLAGLRRAGGASPGSAPDGDGLQSPAEPPTAGPGAFGGVLSTPFGWVLFSA